jgi:hypothetical protein
MQLAGQGFLARMAAVEREHQWNTQGIKPVQNAFKLGENDSKGGMPIRP